MWITNQNLTLRGLACRIELESNATRWAGNGGWGSVQEIVWVLGEKKKKSKETKTPPTSN